LAQEKLSVSSPDADNRLLFLIGACTICLVVSGGVVYFVMSSQLSEKDEETARLNQQHEEEVNRLNQEVERVRRVAPQEAIARGMRVLNDTGDIGELMGLFANPVVMAEALRLAQNPQNLQILRNNPLLNLPDPQNLQNLQNNPLLNLPDLQNLNHPFNRAMRMGVGR
jgi:hypothetical protein